MPGGVYRERGAYQDGSAGTRKNVIFWTLFFFEGPVFAWRRAIFPQVNQSAAPRDMQLWQKFYQVSVQLFLPNPLPFLSMHVFSAALDGVIGEHKTF